MFIHAERLKMEKNKQPNDYYIEDSNEDLGLDDSEAELSFDKKSLKQHQKSKPRKLARRCIEEYFERKALKERNWDFEDELYN